MQAAALKERIEQLWKDSIVPSLIEYIRIPNQSPAFDPDWQAHGYMQRVVELAHAWVESQQVAGSRLEVMQLPGRTPLLLLEIEGSAPGNVLMYGHLDKQPPFEGWREGLGAWTPVYVEAAGPEQGRLYGRGGADDGYAVFASVAAVKALQEQNVALPRIVVCIECSEESGSPDLPAYMQACADRIGRPDLVICLDSGAGDYQRLWATTSLRGLVAGTLRVQVLREGVHSGDAGGVVASSFRILRILLDRLENASDGRLLPEQLHVEIPALRREQAKAAAAILGETLYSKYAWHEGMGPVSDDVAELVLARTWRPSLSVTGVEGMPALEQAGNVLRPQTAVKLSLRVPPGVDAEAATAQVARLLCENPPYGARVSFEPEQAADGWQAPPGEAWLEDAVDAASRQWFGAPAAAMGEGGTIPFMAMLGEQFPRAQFLITGVLGPESNAHGPNEFLHVPYATRLTCAVAEVLCSLPRQED